MKGSLPGLLLILALGLSPADELVYAPYYVVDNKKNTVFTSSFYLAKSVLSRTLLLLDIELDQLSVPPLDGVTGASRPTRRKSEPFLKNRGQIIAGLQQGLSPTTTVTIHGYTSQELDYRSQSVRGAFSQDMAQNNFNVTLVGQYGADHVGEIRNDGSLVEYFRESRQADLVFMQLLTPKTSLHFGFSGEQELGFLSDPYRLVEVDDGAQALKERHPDERRRGAAWVEARHNLVALEAALLGGYRFYRDDWDVESHRIQVKMNKRLSRNWILSPAYRYYIQSGARFYHELPASTHLYLTADRKLSPLGSHMAQLSLTWMLRGLAEGSADWKFLNGSSLTGRYFHYFNDIPIGDTGTGAPGFRAHVMEATWRFVF